VPQQTISSQNNNCKPLYKAAETRAKVTGVCSIRTTNNQQHKTILSLLRQAQWVVPNGKWGEVPDINRLSEFLKSDKSPVNKPLKKMEPLEVSKIIEALKGIVKSKYK
jgi:hypothetical protein